MTRYEIFSGPGRNAILIGLVMADTQDVAIDTLYRHGSALAADERPAGGAYVEWAHPELPRLPNANLRSWRAIPVAPGQR